MSPSLGLSLHEKRKGHCLARTFGHSHGGPQDRLAGVRVGHQSPGAIVFALAFFFFCGASVF
jgi:hypothetical protein